MMYGKTLSNREAEVLVYILKGLSNMEAADELFITEKTIKFHLTHVYKKIGVKSRTEAIAKYYRRQLAPQILQQIDVAKNNVDKPKPVMTNTNQTKDETTLPTASGNPLPGQDTPAGL